MPSTQKDQQGDQKRVKQVMHYLCHCKEQVVGERQLVIVRTSILSHSQKTLLAQQTQPEIQALLAYCIRPYC